MNFQQQEYFLIVKGTGLYCKDAAMKKNGIIKAWFEV